MTEIPWIAILSSTVLGGIAGAVIAGSFMLLAKRNEFRNEYYKTVISRRIDAYETLEKLILSLKTTVLDDDGQKWTPDFGQAVK